MTSMWGGDERAGGLGHRPRSPDLLPQVVLPRLRGRFGRPYRYLGVVGSTQDALRQWARAGAPEGAVVLAERQTAGRGRWGRAWVSPGGGLYFSVLLRPVQPLPLLPLAAGVALVDACQLGGLKWPNDLLAPDGRKLAGVLAEAEVQDGGAQAVYLGVGLNVEPDGLPLGAAGLAEFRPVDRAELLAEVLWALEVWTSAPPEAVGHAWRQRNCTLGRWVRVTMGEGAVEGVAVDLAADGALVVQTRAGQRTVRAGDVAHLRHRRT
ncbi:MAG: biotin--[acetyl-CoA-carboxylase] ligase [Candidatus Acetothermia bacterium]|nr:biotin--[acetyl-CoA-carboxylase] ligase [Candidatus Acetothermia bacterium]